MSWRKLFPDFRCFLEGFDVLVLNSVILLAVANGDETVIKVAFCISVEDDDAREGIGGCPAYHGAFIRGVSHQRLNGIVEQVGVLCRHVAHDARCLTATRVVLR